MLLGAAILSRKIDSKDLVLSRLQVIRLPARFIVSVGLESTSLVNLSSWGNPQSADYQSDSPVHNTESVSFPMLYYTQVPQICESQK